MKTCLPALTLVACCLVGSAMAQTTATEPWVRGTLSPAQKATGLFVQLQNAQGARLVTAASPAAGIVEIHEMAMVDGVMRMRALKDGLELPAGQTVHLKPGGYHVMLIDLKQPLKEGDTVPVTLTLKGKNGKDEVLSLQAPVRQSAAPMKH
ncbi:MAG: copper chaperone PCu(A)C [Burkholderiales bacterium]|uniref:copper chaperone PCu(A)C n=1 Tax=Inhella sp. TaxID=1921806 RepID=UPI001AC7024A|nr:copper chaperone PCu(A)C [Burkholderiales bacterium]